MTIRTMTAVGALLALAACGGEEAGAGNESAAAGTPAAQPGGSDAQIEPGLWETTTEFVKIEGLPKEAAAGMGAGQKTTSQQCITPEDVKDANAGIFAGEEDKNCKKEGFEFKNGRVAGKLTCTEPTSQGTTTFAINGQYSARTYDMSQRISTTVQGTSMVMETRVQGRRVGDCPAGEQEG